MINHLPFKEPHKSKELELESATDGMFLNKNFHGLEFCLTLDYIEFCKYRLEQASQIHIISRHQTWSHEVALRMKF